MKITTGRYAAILAIQTILLITDWNINIFALLARQSNALMLVFFIVQDAGLIISLSILLLTFFSTYVFQMGLVYLLYEKFRTTLMICMFYFILTNILHIWSMITRWNDSRNHWSTGFLILFIIQRFAAAIYYYTYKRASLRIADHRFYEDLDSKPDKQTRRSIEN
ncbi:transmembrane protein 138 [Anthonomus grandis grandis]|uniref:transmembrane protein 138 n=1 Tax=Anthonomus grandis grandis TaxID=2921223 RepID=UPI002166ACBF|nr:transmembrane protein 138 [Anthonomus grandis grandis]